MAVSRATGLQVGRSRWLTIIVVLGAFLVGGLLTPSQVSAHAELVNTTPAEGALLETQPDQVTLTFTEAVEPVQEAFRLFNSDGLVATLETPATGETLEIALPGDLADGTYVVDWRVVSLDSHPITGALTFSIGEESGAPVEVATSSSDVTPIASIVQGIAYLSLLSTVGLIWFRVFVVRDVDGRTISLATGGAILSAIAHLLLIPLTTIRQVGESIGALADPEMWEVEPLSVTLRAVIFVVAGLAIEIHFARSSDATRRTRRAVALGGLLALGSLTVVGHTADIPPTWLMHGSDFVHGAAGAIWFGGLLGLGRYLYVALRTRSSGNRPGPGDAAQVVARFSWLAGWAFAALAISGAVIAFKILGSWDALLHTTYGRILIAKLSLVVIPFGLAVWNRLRLVPSVQRDPEASSAWNRLRTTVLTEAGLLVVVLSLTGFLVLQNPAVAGSDGVEAVAAVPFEEAEALGDGSLEITITPAMTGENEISLMVHDADGLPIQLLVDPEIRLSLPEAGLGPITSTATSAGHPGHYASQVQVPFEGEWTVEVVTRISKYEEPMTTFTVPIPHLPD
ncbi:MAG TPA: copper resistance protein CopC [Thermomicrobiales bacterium]|nr:copper resistance protein CopC [Thermomicrobiales bacterium]